MHSNLIIKGIETTDLIYESSTSLIFKTKQEGDAPKTILKVLKSGALFQKEIVRFHQEHAVAGQFESPYIGKVCKIIKKDDFIALQVEDIEGESLTNWLAKDPPSLTEGLNIAISICKGLRAIHDKKTAHKNITCQNVIWNRETNQVKIIDFGISSVLGKDIVLPEASGNLDGDLSYISPEQTGRMNRPVDYRTDFYSLGVTLYELFTGEKPFVGSDPIELIYCHIAKKPIDPSEINPDIPSHLGRIIMKLLEKNAEDRYQSANGLEHDLQEVLRRYQEKSPTDKFDLAMHDQTERFLIPSKLYGREGDIAQLNQAFDKVCKGNMVLSLVNGYSGVGKSSLVQELYRPLAAARGRYIGGKYDQYQRNVPYSAIAIAFNRFCEQILAEPQEKLENWRNKILHAVGKNGLILIEVVSQLEKIIGPQPGVPKIDPQAAKNRFNQLFVNFISEICHPNEPLVIFLDDLQWADQASLDLLKMMFAQTQIKGLHVVGAYRDNEVEASHPLQLTLDEIKKAGKTDEIISLSNLDQHNITALVSETLTLKKNEVQDLVAIICRKTLGNAFFATEFFKNLHTSRLLTYSNNKWQWDIQKIEKQNITENVVEFMASKVDEFEPQTRDALKLAACIGNEFDLRTLSVILKYDTDLKNTLHSIMPAIQSGIIIPKSDEYKKVGIVDVQGESVIFRFQHDRVQQASYSLISENERPKIHHQIGYLLLQHATKAENLEDRLFEIVSHFNKGLPVVQELGERLRIADLNYNAGLKARDTSAYQASSEYFAQAKMLLPGDVFQSHYEIALKIHLALARSLSINSEFEKSEKLYPLLLASVTSSNDEVEVRIVQMEDYHLQGDYEKAIDVQKKGLALLGEEFPKEAAQLEESILEELRLTPKYLNERNVENLLDAPEIKEKKTLAKLRLLTGMWMSAYLVSKDPIVQWCSVKMANLSLRFGNSEFAANAYVQYGYICVVRLNKPEEGWEYGNLAIRLADRYENVEMRGKVYFNFALFVNHWTKHIKTSTELFRRGYLFSIEGGDWTYAVYGAANIISNLLIEGKPYNEIEKEGRKYFEFLRSKAEIGLNSFFLPGGFVALLNLQGKTASWDSFDCEYLNENKLLNGLGKLPIVEAWFYSAKLRSLYLFRYLEKAKEVVQKSDIVFEGVPSQIKVPEAYFYSCLILTATYSSMKDLALNDSHLKLFEKYAADIQKWSTHCPENFLHKHLLIQAETARLKQLDIKETLSLYDAAITSARTSGYLNNAALAEELKGRFWLEHGEQQYASIHLKEAFEGYKNLGIEGKAAQLLEEFPQLAQKNNSASTSNIVENAALDNYALDLQSIYKSAQAISSKVDWSELIGTILTIVMENMGASSCILFLKQHNTWAIEARAKVEQKTGKLHVKDMRGEEIEKFSDYPQAVINYVSRTKETLMFDSTNLPAQFHNEAYFGSSKISILCSPIISQDKVVGILYLENDLSCGVFNKSRKDVLSILISQITISLESAQLYGALEEKLLESKRAEQAISLYVDALKRSNEDLEENVEQFHLLANSLPTLVWRADETGWIHWYNDRWYEYTGTTPKEMEGWGWQSVHDPEKLPAVMENWQKSIATGEPFEMVFPLKGADGIFRAFLTRIWPVKDANGKVTKWLGTNTDINAQKLAEDKALKALSISETRNQQLLDGVQDYAIYWLDLEGHVESWNSGAEQIKGYTAQEIIGQSFSRFYTEEDQKKGLPQKALDAARTKGKFEGEGWRVRKDGSRFWASVDISAIYDHTGAVSSFAKVTRDITERRKAEQNKAQLAAIIEFSDDAIIGRDLEGMITSWNDAAARMFGYSKEEAIGRPNSSLVPADRLDEELEVIKTLMMGGHTKHYETVRLQKNGNLIPISLTVSPIRDQSGKIIGISKIARDITERKEMERHVSEFYSMVSHELRTPLTSIRGTLSLMNGGRVGSLPPRAQQLTQIALSESERLIRLINDILDIRKIEAGKLNLILEEVLPSEIVSVTLQALESMAEQSFVKLIGHRSTTDKISCDRDRIVQVLTNLISNAIKFSPKDSEVTVEVESLSPEITRFSVSDRGAGIAKDQLPKLFGLFQQLDSSDSRPKGGTGLGLAISKAIVEQHGGTIGVDSIVEQGSTFWFELPCRKSANIPKTPLNN